MDRHRARAAGWRRLAIALATAGTVTSLAASPPAIASPMPLGSPEIWNWAQTTVAHGLKAAEPGNDLAVGGLAALNYSIRSSLDTIRQIVPPRLQRLDIEVRFRDDLRAGYRVATVQPVARRMLAPDVVDIRGRLDYDPAGRTSGRVGFGYHGRLADEALTTVVQSGVDRDENSRRDRYVIESELAWAPLQLRASAFNDVPFDAAPEPPGRERLLDGYALAADLRLPYLPWARLRAARTWTANGDDPRATHRLGLRLQPFSALAVETGTRSGTDQERSWFARFRFRLDLGGAA